ncbi:MAG: MFS transporter [Pirellulaceae bacterium]|nr:MFS transporter [Pirellulaceae bacterium]
MRRMNSHTHRASQPNLPLMRDISFWGMSITQFLGAFNDNLYKQLVLLLSIPVVVSSFQQDQQDIATIVFSLPFVLFSGYAGYLSDRYSKRRIIVASKVAEIVAMLLGLLAFILYRSSGYPGLLVVLFLMGTQSAFFGPGKYGILPELFRYEDLPRANGIILMLTFLAIIFGTVSAGYLKYLLVDVNQPLAEQAHHLAIGSAACVVIAVIGTVIVFIVRKVPAAKSDLKFVWASLFVRRDTLQILRADRPLVAALLASSMFWLVSGIAIQAVNSLGIVQLRLNSMLTSVMTAMVGLGISVGAVIAGKLCQGRANPKVVRVGLWGLVSCLVLLSISWPVGPAQATGVKTHDRQLGSAVSMQSTAETAAAGSKTGSAPEYHHLLGFQGSLVVLALLGVAAGFFAIPVQVFIQSRPPDEQKGRMIAVMNQANFLAILLSGVLYGLFSRFIVEMEWPRSPLFALMAILIFPVLLFYHPTLSDSDA